VLDALRQPIETGEIHVSRANAHVRYPAASCWSPPPIPAAAAIWPTRPAPAPARRVCGADYLGRISAR
jgi:magnesium chelatase family protein